MVVLVTDYTDGLCSFPFAAGDRPTPFALGVSGGDRKTLIFGDGSRLPIEAVEIVDPTWSSLWVEQTAVGLREPRALRSILGVPGFAADVDAFLGRDAQVVQRYAALARLLEMEGKPTPARPERDGDWCFCTACPDAWLVAGGWTQRCPSCDLEHAVLTWEQAAAAELAKVTGGLGA